MSEQPMPICIPCKRTLGSNGYEVIILKGRLFRKMSCIHCGNDTNLLGTIEKAEPGKKRVLVTA